MRGAFGPRIARKGTKDAKGFRGSRGPDVRAATAAGDTARVQEIEAEIDGLARELWGLSREELAEIQRSLAELG